MNIFDFLFPEQAQASHLRRLSESSALLHSQARINSSRGQQAQMSLENRIESLQSEVGQLAIVIEALLESLADRGILTREELARKMSEIDARDGVVDGRITKQNPGSIPPMPK